MNDIERCSLLEAEVSANANGAVTILKAEIGVTEHGSINFESETLVACYIYNNTSYSLAYAVVDHNGALAGCYIDREGVLPTLFKSPSNEAYVSICPVHASKDVEISIPVFNRADVEYPKAGKPFTGSYMGVVGSCAIFYDVDIWQEKKPDRMLSIEFKNGKIVKKHSLKVSFPKNNKACICDNKIHLLARCDNYFVHRMLDEFGNEIKVRNIKHNGLHLREIASISFTDTSIIITDEDGVLTLAEVDADGCICSKEAIAIGDKIFNTWAPVEIGSGMFVVRFNTELGNGWFTLHNGNLLECFYSKGVTDGYKSLLAPAEKIVIGKKNLAIAAINKTKDRAYAVVMYPIANSKSKNKELIILNRCIK